MVFRDDDLTLLEAEGPPPLPQPSESGWIDSDGARIWFATFGSGPAVLLLHGGLGNAGNWTYQVPAIVAAGYRAIVIDSRGHGRSTRDARPFTYQLMAGDVRAVLDRTGVDRATIIGWSDGADTGLVLADETPERVAGLFFFACNVDSTGTLPFEFTPIIGRIYNQHVKDYAALSSTPEAFQTFADDLGAMQRTEPAYSAAQLRQIDVPVQVVLGEHDEFIRPEHMAYLAETLPNASLTIIPEVSHFAPLQRPDVFNALILDFVRKTAGGGG